MGGTEWWSCDGQMSSELHKIKGLQGPERLMAKGGCNRLEGERRKIGREEGKKEGRVEEESRQAHGFSLGTPPPCQEEMQQFHQKRFQVLQGL